MRLPHPRFAAIYQKKMKELDQLARQKALIGVVVTAPLLLVCLLISEWVLGRFGNDLTAGAPLLRIIASVQLVKVPLDR